MPLFLQKKKQTAQQISAPAHLVGQSRVVRQSAKIKRREEQGDEEQHHKIRGTALLEMGHPYHNITLDQITV